MKPYIMILLANYPALVVDDLDNSLTGSNVTQMNKTQESHYLVGRYVTNQPDGVHIEARYTCGLKLEGIGEDESQAIDSLWKASISHRRQQNPGLDEN